MLSFSAFCTPLHIALPQRGAVAALHYNQPRFGHTSKAGICSPLTRAQLTNANTTSQTSFGRGQRFPRRLVGLYELERLGIDSNRIVVPNSRDEAGLSVIVAAAVVAVLGTAFLSPVANLETPVALSIATLLVVWAVDTLGFNGILARAISASLQSQRRIAIHEAGHFLVSHLLGVRVDSYSILSPSKVLASFREQSLAPGVKLSQNEIPADSYVLAAVGMAGIAAEVVHYGGSEGGGEDLAEVSRVVRNATTRALNEEDLKKISRWGLMQGVTLLQDHRNALVALADAMQESRSVEECTACIDKNVQHAKLVT